MLNPITTQKLEQLGLKGMLRTLLLQQQQPEARKLSFEERLGMLVDAELSDRDTRRIERLLKSAKLRHGSASLESVNYRVLLGAVEDAPEEHPLAAMVREC